MGKGPIYPRGLALGGSASSVKDTYKNTLRVGRFQESSFECIGYLITYLENYYIN